MKTDRSTEPIRLGLMPPLTGLVGMYGPDIVRGATIACDEVNAFGGICGKQLELVIEDDGSLPGSAIPAALRLIDQHQCVALVGNLLSNSRIAVAEQVSEPRRIPQLNFSFYEGSISSRYFFHFAALPNQQIDKMIPFMAKRHGQKMFFAGNNYEWPRGSIDAAIRSLRAHDGDVLGEEYLPIDVPGLAIDALLTQVERSGADVFVPYFAGSDQLKLLTRFTERGLKRRMAVVMGHFDEMMASQLSPAVREGFFSSNSYFMSVDTPSNARFLSKLASFKDVQGGLWPNGNGILTNFGEGAYVCVRAFAEAASAAQSTEPEALVAALETTRVNAPQGEVLMDAETHHAHVNTYLAQCERDGTFTIVEQFGRIAPIIPERYRDRLLAHRKNKSATKVSSEVSVPAAQSPEQPAAPKGTAEQILSMTDMAVLTADENGSITDANPSAYGMFGYEVPELIGLPVHQLVPPHLRGRHSELIKNFVAASDSVRQMTNRTAVHGYRKDGSFFPAEVSLAKVKTPNGFSLVATLRDISARQKAEEEMLWKATHDPLTLLPNRELIRERLANALLRSQRSGLTLGVLFVDLDGFKMVNDTYGHAAGDEILKQAASRLVDLVRPGDTVARLAGDEFVVLCEQLDQPTTVSAVAQRIQSAMQVAMIVDDRPLVVTTSIGIAVGSGAQHQTDDLLRSADSAMYEVKRRGGNGWQFFNQTLEQKARQRLVVTQGLRQALVRNELSCCFQPIVSAHNRSIVAAELLLRWHSPEGEISPAVFIPIAEMSGPIVEIGEWVFRQGCKTEVEWRHRWRGLGPSSLSINVSTRQLNDEHLAKTFETILRETGADPSRLLLEITETSLMADVEANLLVLRRLADLGLRVAVDDFGTGYSSLAQLTRLPVSVLKIDKVFVDGIDSKDDSRMVVRAIIGLARALGMKLIAEGVETEAQLIELRNQGCDLIQGFHCHRPMDENSFVALIDRQQGAVDTSLGRAGTGTGT